MNEIEKMYSNAGIKCLHPSGFCKHIGATCEVCERHKYPLLTAKKQIELIKWLTYYDEVCRMEKIRDGWFVEIDMITSELSPTFKEALANLINKIWQDLTEEERTQIKEILK